MSGKFSHFRNCFEKLRSSIVECNKAKKVKEIAKYREPMDNHSCKAVKGSALPVLTVDIYAALPACNHKKVPARSPPMPNPEMTAFS